MANIQVLKDTTESMEIVLSEAVSTNELQWTSSYVTDVSGTQTAGSQNGVTNGTTDVVLVTAPASGQALVKEITVYNADTATATITIKFVDGANERIIETTELAAGASYQFSGTSGAGGGTTSPLTTKGDLYTYDTDNQRLAVGADGQMLVPDSTEPTGLKYVNQPIQGFANLQVTGVTTKTTILSTTISADSMGAKGGFRLLLPLYITTTAGNMALTVDFGSTQIFVETKTLIGLGSYQQFTILDLSCSNKNSTSSQLWLPKIDINSTTWGFTATAGTMTGSAKMMTGQTSAEDTTGDKTLTVSVTPSSSATAIDRVNPILFGPFTNS